MLIATGSPAQAVSGDPATRRAGDSGHSCQGSPNALPTGKTQSESVSSAHNLLNGDQLAV
jgi:hypothetical protein